MREIVCFVEDSAHQQVLSSLLQRIADDFGVPVLVRWLNARRGHGAVIRELKLFLRDLQADRGRFPDLVLVATDANCSGYANRRAEITDLTDRLAARVICAIPDPHIERWLLLDSAAFRSVFGQGCDAPDQKCERSRYKRMLADSIRKSGVDPSLGGIEFAEDILAAMDLGRASRADASFKRLIDDLRSIFKKWQTLLRIGPNS